MTYQDLIFTFDLMLIAFLLGLFVGSLKTLPYPPKRKELANKTKNYLSDLLRKEGK